MVNTDKQFLDAIHDKIANKRRQWAIIFSSAMLVFAIFITYEASERITYERYELLWSEYQSENTEYYIWELFGQISDETMYIYLLDLYEVDEILDILDDSTELLHVLKTTSLEG